MRLIAAALLVALSASPLLASRRVVEVADDAQLKAALADARPGDTIRLTGKEYHRVFCTGLHGERGKPIIIESATSQPAVFLGAGGTGMQFCQPSYLTIRNIVIRGSAVNGLNIDDGGRITDPASHVEMEPAHDVILDHVQVFDTGPKGNFNGIKLSGVDRFQVRKCTVSGWGGSGIDMVGCHDGAITGCTFRGKAEEGFSQDRGIQMKGGSRDLRVKGCRFENGGVRALNIGGVTGLEFFRPPASQADAYEAKDIVVEGCWFTGSEAPVAFVGIDGATVRCNTFYRPGKWIMRIVQENPLPQFVPCRKGRFEHNVVVFNKADLNPAVNIGEKTAPETFVFAGNIWYCMDDPSASRPALPARETDGQYGRDPKLKDPAKGDLTITDVDIAKTLPGLAAADPTRNAEARALLEEGLKLYEQGRVIGIPLAFSKEKMKSALEKFETLSQTCPESDSAADAYFYAAEIIKDCLRSDARDDAKSTDYYQRAYQVDPNLSHPAHFQRAVVLDYRLHNRDEALVEYRNVLKFEANKPFFWSKTNADYAAHRIKELGGPGE